MKCITLKKEHWNVFTLKKEHWNLSTLQKKSTEMCQLLVKKIVFKLSPFEKKITSWLKFDITDTHQLTQSLHIEPK